MGSVSMLNCITCKNQIQVQRINALPNTKTCTKCSTIEQVGCVDITYHKTGNTIQIMDKQSAAKINKLAQRSGYGIMRGLRGGTSSSTKSKLTGSTRHMIRIPTRDDFEKAGEEVMYLIESKSKASAIKYINEALDSRMISGSDYRQLKDIVNTVSPDQVLT
tara:strand:- start:588 stop:1073 length:486 start_codon:yes stop_codon:yes gene_type:complete